MMRSLQPSDTYMAIFIFRQQIRFFLILQIHQTLLLKITNLIWPNSKSFLFCLPHSYQVQLCFNLANLQAILSLYIQMNSQERSSMLSGHQLMELAVSKLKEEDLMHRGFLKPIEIALKTSKTENESNDKKPTVASLPAGLKIAVKNSISENKYSLCNVKVIEGAPTLQELQEQNQDNMLTLMKSTQGMELAICVCMYSEDKKMLKSTLAGIADNIVNIVCDSKIDPDKIGVFVMMDGVEKVDSSVIDYFEEEERSNNINLGENIAPTMSLEEMNKRAQTMTPEQINDEQMKNVNNFLFTVAELQDRNQRRFSSVRQQYDEIKKLFSKIQQLKKQKPLFDDLPNKLRPFFISEARQQRKKEYSLSEDEVKKISEERLIEQYALDVRKAKPLVMKALQEGERYCKEYISSRDDLAYLGAFRHKVSIPLSKLLPRGDASNNRYRQEPSVNELIDEQSDANTSTVMNLFLCVKYKNSGKLSSHNWFFNGFCKELRPRYAILLDVGLRPYPEALCKMYNHMVSNKKVGGVCGYMSLKIEKVDESEEVQQEDVDCITGIMLKFADIQRTQQVEYHFAHLMDKPFEASFGFIHVLPGAFSAYNMDAIIKYDEADDDKLLKSYFKSIEQKLQSGKVVKSQLSIGSVLLRTMLPDFINSCFISIDQDSQEQLLYNENIYLAQDRILCMGIHKKGYDMAFLPDAYAEVDPIKTVHGLLGQRKRWINGSFFAFEKVKKELKEHESDNGVECFLRLQMFYLTLMNALSYFAPAFFLFTVHIAMEAFRADVLTKVLGGVVGNPDTSEIYNAFVYTMDWIYVMLIGSIIFLSLHLTNNNKKYKPYVYAVSTLFGLFSICVFLVLVVDVFRGLIDNEAFLINNKAMIQVLPGGQQIINIMRWILVGSTLIYVVPIMAYLLMFGRANILCQIILGAFSFLFYGPTYLNILNIYSLCRIDDISWGTKGLDSGSNKNAGLKDSWKLIKFVHVGKYVIWNIIVGVVLLSLGSNYQPRFFITIVMVGIMGSTLSIKILIGLIYMIGYKLSQCCKDRPEPMKPDRTRIDNFVSEYSKPILQEIKSNLTDMAKEFEEGSFKRYGGSFIQASRTKNNVKKSFKKHTEQVTSRSKIVHKQQKMSLASSNLPVIAEQGEQSYKEPSKKKTQTIPRVDSQSSLSQSPEKQPLKKNYVEEIPAEPKKPAEKKEKKFKKESKI